MLKTIVIDKKKNGKKIAIPLQVTAENIEQQVKLFIEMTDYNPFDGQLHISHFRLYHGKDKTFEVLRSVLSELDNPTIEVDIQSQREELKPFFEAQLARHKTLDDNSFGYPGDKSKLPI